MDLAEHPAGNEPPVVNILDEQVALGLHRRELLPIYQRWINDFAALRTLGAGPPEPTTMEQEAAWYVPPRADETLFTIYERASWRPIGTTALHGIDHRKQTAVFGIFAGEASARGRGFGTEATG